MRRGDPVLFLFGTDPQRKEVPSSFEVPTNGFPHLQGFLESR